MDAPSAYTVGGAKTLDNGLRVLDAAALAGRPGLTVAELARDTGLDRTVAHRLVITLCRRHLLRRTEDGRYVVGFGVLDLAAAVRPDLQRAAAGVLLHLADEVGATAHLSVLDGDDVVSVATYEPRSTSIHVAYRVGTRHPADRGAAGMAVLIGRPARRGERREITAGRRRGYATSRGEIQAGAWGLSAPVIRSGVGRLADASVGVIALRAMAEPDVAPHVLAAADRIAGLVP